MNISLLFTSTVMEFSWLYALISIMVYPTWGFNFPIVLGLLIFITGAFLTYITAGRGWKIINILLVQILGLLMVALFTFHYFYSLEFNLFNINQMLITLKPDNLQEGFLLVIIIISLLVLWWGGIFFTRRTRAYGTVIDRFEKGIAIFAFLIFLKGIIPVQLSSNLLMMFVLFFIFSILSIAMARSKNQGVKEYLTNYINLGIITVFIIILSFIIIIGLIFGLPYLTATADFSFKIFKAIMRPFLPLIVGFLRFMFNFKGNVNTGGVKPSGSGDSVNIPPGEENWLLALIDIIMSHILLVIGVVILAIIGWIVIKNLIKWLLSSDKKNKENISFKTGVKKLLFILRLISKKLQFKKEDKVIKIYKRVLLWGSLIGLRKLSAETPREYGLRLSYNFPFLEEDFKVIIDKLYKNVYGKKDLNNKEERDIKEAYREILRIGNWCYYLKYMLSIR